MRRYRSVRLTLERVDFLAAVAAAGRFVPALVFGVRCGLSADVTVLRATLVNRATSNVYQRRRQTFRQRLMRKGDGYVKTDQLDVRGGFAVIGEHASVRTETIDSTYAVSKCRCCFPDSKFMRIRYSRDSAIQAAERRKDHNVRQWRAIDRTAFSDVGKP